jgi:trk system potassium uptake protein
VIEATNPATLAALPPPLQAANAIFFSVVPRTAGFATLDVGDFRDATLFFLIGLMFIGGSAGSTAGGIKVNTLGAIAATVLSSIKGRPRPVAFGREIPATVAMRALTMAALSMLFVFAGALLLAWAEPFEFIALLFEATSAFGTVGLTTGITPRLTEFGKLVLIAMMFVGRLGPLALAVALAGREQPDRLRYPDGNVRIG